MMRIARFLIVILALATPALAELKLPAVIGDHMVLQQKKKIHVWGWADPGAKVRVVFTGQVVSSVAGEDGRWSVHLDKHKAGGPHELTISTDKGEKKVITDVLVGEVWVCSGQSNMEWTAGAPMGIDDGPKHIAEANHPQIRLFDVANVTAETPQADVKGNWQPCTPESMARFSAIGYFFGRKLHKELNVPIGLIGSNWGGTISEAWTSPEALKKEKSLAATVTTLSAANADPKAAANPNRPSVLYNGMIAPLTPFPIRGAIWYQGESNVPRAAEYRIAFPAMVQSWRKAWGDKFPFFFVQIAPFKYSTAFNNAFGVNEYGLPVLWDSQLIAQEKIRNTGMVVIHDVGNVDDIHPRNKLVVGERLATWALEDTYKVGKLTVSGPIFSEMESRWGHKMEIEFFHEGSGLATRDGKAPDSFEIAGEDRVFYPATAEINSDDTVLVYSPQVKNPDAVRFGWHETATPNLINKEGLPASPFRTDDWPVDTKPKN